jgi:NAD+ synthetase
MESQYLSNRNSLDPELVAFLASLRANRNFDAEALIEGKIRLLNQYMNQAGLKSCVVGVSGGIDSAVTLGILMRASQAAGSPIRKIVPVLMPIFNTNGASNQDVALTRGREVIERFGLECIAVDLSDSHAVLKNTIDSSVGIPGNAWSAGQLVSYLRTPALFYITSLLTQEALPSILVGTTNRDEGGYIGYFGKAADGMVDLQLISDIHKSEVFAVARLLDIPQSVLEAAPTGDIYDGRTDEELIGVSYDAIELYTLYLSLPKYDQEHWLARLNATATSQFDLIKTKLDTINRQCAHKYIGDSPAVHLDLYEKDVPGGWRKLAFLDERLKEKKSDSEFVNLIQLDEDFVGRFRAAPTPKIEKEIIGHFADSVSLFKNVLTKNECKEMLNSLATVQWTAVGLNGILTDYEKGHDPIGSYRATAFSEDFSKAIWSRISPHLSQLKFIDDMTPTDGEDHSIWRAVGVSPVLRLIYYTGGGSLIPHYDSPYQYHAGKKTLMSVVIYLSETQEDVGGATRFILDGQRNLPFSERVFCDWNRFANESEVLEQIRPVLGSILVFNHRLLHDSEAIKAGGEKLIIRTDIIFERCGLDDARPAKESKALGLPETQVKMKTNGNEAEQPLANSIQFLALARTSLDPFYGSLLEKSGSQELLIQAGYFDNGRSESILLSPQAQPHWSVTPVHKIVKRFRKAPHDKPYAVLLTTGAFCPVHQGHIQMMEAAKREIEASGMFVLGGYISPSHDRYVRSKCKSASINAEERIKICEQAVLNNDWIMVDSWESLHCDCSINFTDVILRLERYLGIHLKTMRPVQVVYVYGSDNAGFSLAFVGRGRAVCVARPGFTSMVSKISKHPLISSNSRIMFVKKAGLDVSSTEIRNGTHLEYLTHQNYRIHSKPKHYLHLLRNEEDWGIEPWLVGRDLKMLRDSWSLFTNRLSEILNRQFIDTTVEEERSSAQFKFVSLSEQRLAAQRFIQGRKFISLDPCIPGDFNLAVSRRFPSGYGGYQSDVGERPGFVSLLEQIKQIPDGDYILLDDDIATGATMKKIVDLIPDRIRILETLALVRLNGEQGYYELSDCRDFLIGSRQGGLVVGTAAEDAVRLPYMLPYVSPAERASTPTSCDWDLSCQLWRLNVDFFQSVQRPILLSEAEPAFQKFMTSIGFLPSDSLLTVCKWHLSRMSSRHLEDEEYGYAE